MPIPSSDAGSISDNTPGPDTQPPAMSMVLISDFPWPSCRCEELLSESDYCRLQLELDPLKGCNKCSSAGSNEDTVDFERLLRSFASASASSGFDDTCLSDIIAPPGDNHVSVPHYQRIRRTKSCIEQTTTPQHNQDQDDQQVSNQQDTACRLRIGYHDEELRERCRQNAHSLLQQALNVGTDTPSTSMILARKALKYRRILERIENSANINDPAFDILESLGVRWQRVLPSK